MQLNNNALTCVGKGRLSLLALRFAFQTFYGRFRRKVQELCRYGVQGKQAKSAGAAPRAGMVVFLFCVCTGSWPQSPLRMCPSQMRPPADQILTYRTSASMSDVPILTSRFGRYQNDETPRWFHVNPLQLHPLVGFF